jgi:hypothetical protein
MPIIPDIGLWQLQYARLWVATNSTKGAGSLDRAPPMFTAACSRTESVTVLQQHVRRANRRNVGNLAAQSSHTLLNNSTPIALLFYCFCCTKHLLYSKVNILPWIVKMCDSRLLSTTTCYQPEIRALSLKSKIQCTSVIGLESSDYKSEKYNCTVTQKELGQLSAAMGCMAAV